MHIGDVTSEAIERLQLKDKDFERFVGELLTAEHEMRHTDADLRGPVAQYHGDQKRDLVFEVRKAPKTSREDFHHALTWDDIGQTWYSCKGGSRWKSSFLRELGQSAANKDTAPSRRTKKRPPDVLLAHLARGGRLVFVVAEGTIGEPKFLEEMAGILSFWLSHSTHARPPNLHEQLTLIDANTLARFISRKRPETLSAQFRKALGLNSPPGFVSWDQWSAELGEGRDVLDFESDPSRDTILAAIADNRSPIVGVFGPPGTGKTRVVHEGLRRLGPDARARVRYCNNLDDAYRMRSWLRDGGSVWIVLDELRSMDVEQLVPTFSANAPPGARLFLIGTSDVGTRAEPGGTFELAPLDDTAIERVIEREISHRGGTSTRERIRLVRELSENYPWYAVLLARAIARDPTSIEHGVDDASRWNFGARRVLAGNPRSGEHGDYASDSEWEREAELRGKCLLVAMMTRDLELPWEELWDRYGERLALAIDEAQQGHEVQRREVKCRQRQLLRQSGLRAQRRYVSPNNLARLLLNHFFGGPDGPDLGPKIRRHAPEFRGALLTIARSVRAKASVLDGFARGEFEELDRLARRRDIGAVRTFLETPRGEGRTVTFVAAKIAPGVAARALRRMLDCFDDTTLHAEPRVRQESYYLLAHLTHRRIGWDDFMEVESSLLRLAGIGNDHWSTNCAEAWTNLFLPAFHLTHQPWPARLAQLDQRLRSDVADERSIAVDALATAVDPSEQSVIVTEEDEEADEGPTPSPKQWLHMKAELWDRLLIACGDNEQSVAARARDAVARQLRAGSSQGILASHLQRLAAEVPGWTASQRQALLGSVRETLRYEADGHDESFEHGRRLRDLETKLGPRDLHERIVAHISGENRRETDDGRLDLDHEETIAESLARELLAHPVARDETLDWISTRDEPLRDGFLRVLGTIDHDDVVRPKLVEFARRRGTSSLLSDYLIGRAKSDGPACVETWMDEHSDDPVVAQASIDVLVAQAPSPERLHRLQMLVTHGAPAHGLEEVAHRRWSRRIPHDPMKSFARFLVSETNVAWVALPLVIQMLEGDTEAPKNEDLLDLLHDALMEALEQRVVIAAQGYFERGVLSLVATGRPDAAVSVVVKAYLGSRQHNNAWLGHQVVKALLRRGDGQTMWPHLTPALLGERGSTLAMHLSRDDLLQYVPVNDVLDWIKDDRSRAVIATKLCMPYAEPLDALTRELVIRFGTHGDVASALERRAHSSPHAVWGGLVVFDRQQLENAAQWAQDPHPAVRSWATRLEASFRRRVEEYEAHAEHRRKYG